MGTAPGDENRVVIVICDSLRADLISPADAPFLAELSTRSAVFTAHRSVFPSTTRASAASIATGCRPARHGLLGNTMALDQGDGLICYSAGHPDFVDRLRRATGRTLRAPTLAERLARHGKTAISCANVSPGAAYFQDPDGYGWVYHAAGSYGPGRHTVEDPASAVLVKGSDGDRAMTERFCAEILEDRAPSLAILWLSEPDYTGHHAPLGSPEHRRAIATADACADQVFAGVRRLDPAGKKILFIAGSDHGMETVNRIIELDDLLIDAGLKRGPRSSDVVVAPQGTAATLYFAEPEGGLVARVARFLEGEDWVGRVFVDEALASVGLPTQTAMRLAVTLTGDNAINDHGVAGRSAVIRNALDTDARLGFGQHGGLGVNEQRPFLMIEGGGFAAGRRCGPTSLIDIAPTVLRHLGLEDGGMDGRPLPADMG